MFNPIATYRIQFHKDFTFQNLKNILPYLEDLGITTIYASPIFKAVPGSVHGYDCVDPLSINPEIGTLEELKEISGLLKEKGLSWIQDIVPNHMAFDATNNWLMDILEKGVDSEFSDYFDIIRTTDNEKLMVPFLGKPLETAINDGEIKLVNDKGKIYLSYFDSCYPLSAESVQKYLSNGVEVDKKTLLDIAQSQHYRLCYWQETDYRINYRRFFTVNGLICLNMQDEKVFNRHHSLIKQCLDECIFQGLRVDHIDGLFNPTEYLQRLRKLCGEETYITVEKILEPGEQLPAYWPVQGTTGYDFLAQVNNLFTNKKSGRDFTEFYQQLTRNYKSIPQQLRDKKAYILTEHMGGELDNLYRLFYN